MTKQDLRQLESAFDREDWSTARRVIRRALRDDPTDHWLLTRLSTAYYEDRDYVRALEYSAKAMEAAPDCPLVLWDHACDLDMLGRKGEATAIWKKLLAKGAERIAREECGEGLRWARSLLNDCRYRLALSYADRRRYDEALRYLRQHLAQRGRRVFSIYPLKETRQREQRIRKAREAAQVVAG